MEQKGEDSCGGVATLLRPLKRCKEAQGRPAESEALCREINSGFHAISPQKKLESFSDNTDSFQLFSCLYT
ncbi:hypothetical protein FZC74_17045 [Sutcliffiella horikoshii]|uniref:Uncharacterized protein n=1 Tax=Sutcliffiella horikoshii TaxID=79883 RepID=A0AA95B5K1_9BACI|nr:hypothetical protein FZC74_17045 [Sutcliffiella horikoshii]